MCRSTKVAILFFACILGTGYVAHAAAGAVLIATSPRATRAG